MHIGMAACLAREISFPGGAKSRWITKLVLAGTLAASGAANAAGDVVISQVYGGGGNSGAPFTNDFIELHNNTSTPVALDGWSVQYASATGTGNFQATPLSGTIGPGGYYLVQESKGAGGAQALPPPDASANIAIAATSGKVILARSSTALACNGGSAPCSPAQLALIIDLVGFGGADFFEAAATPALTNTTAAIRAGGGCTDTDNNGADFTVDAPNPRNSASPAAVCNGPVNQPVVAACPASLHEVADGSGTFASAQLTANDADGIVSSAVIQSGDVTGISLNIIQSGNPLTAELIVQATTAVGNYPVTVKFTNSDPTPQSATCTVNVSVSPPPVRARIHDIQGRAHISPLNGQAVAQVTGIVTSVRSNGFTMQDPSPDADPATSEAIFVFTRSAPTVHPGDAVVVDGVVAEFRPAGDPTNLTATEIDSPAITVSSSGNPLPPPVVLGAGGRAIPAGAIASAPTGNVETSTTFDPSNNAIDFYESLEDMRVQFNNAVAVGPSNSFGEIPVLADNASAAALRSARGGAMAGPGNFNPERMILAGTLVDTPEVNVGDQLGTVTAVVDYSFGDYKFDITSPLTVTTSNLQQEVTRLAGTPSQLTVGSFNVENLAPTDPPTKFQALGMQVTNNLHSPDIVALMEIQDSDGAKNDGVVDATTTFANLIAAIQAAGGPAYQFRSIDPVDGQDGGQPGGNIRVGFLFNPARVSFVDRPGGGPTVQTSVVSGTSGPQLSASPGRIQDANGAFANSRKPLAGEFMFNGRRLFVIANHFNAKIGDDPLFGPHQPPLAATEPQRHQQAQIVNTFVSAILALNENAAVVVLGDLNDFEFSQTLDILKTSGALVDTALSLPPDQRYTFVFEGNSEVLDHILVSPALASFASPQLDIVHTNSEFAGQVSDHDPDIVRLRLPLPGDVDGDGDVDGADVIAIAIAAALHTPAHGPFDPRNLNNDAVIDLNDVRLATQACTRPRCALR